MSRASTFVAVCFFASCFHVGCSGGGSNDEGTDISAKPADFSLHSTKFSKELKDDEKGATNKYKDKVIELTGKVIGVGRNISKDAFLRLEGAEGEMLGVMAFTQEKTPWNKVTPGQIVTVKGKFPEFVVTTSLIECQIVKVEGERAPLLTPDELAKEFEKDSEATKKKYDEKFLILQGEIAAKAANDAGAVSLTLKTTQSEVKVKCSFTAFEKEETSALQVGQTVTVLGQFTLNLGEEEVGLYFCNLMDAPKK